MCCRIWSDHSSGGGHTLAPAAGPVVKTRQSHLRTRAVDGAQCCPSEREGDGVDVKEGPSNNGMNPSAGAARFKQAEAGFAPAAGYAERSAAIFRAMGAMIEWRNSDERC